ncbi:hypothetical protein EF903_05940 [Streptomyces sp. WAC05292]|uniref:hypothetical protein n=1 Tax=Streptomyces sp. WAC05292 TaxID=2487418 RepID=UPI000F73F6D4|nr:hypothetical protein [Streptomyces sp. WAC05292]RSS94820.1 hypothetical protein EF903_05940 [Streptomyces sp. WAC05292]
MSREIRQGSVIPDAEVGIFAELVTRSVSPSNAVAIARRLHRIKPEAVSQAVALKQDSRTHDQGVQELANIKDEVLLWTEFLEKKLTETGTRGQDRVMLLTAAYLENAPLEICIKAAGNFGSPSNSNTRFREGRSPRRRMRDVGVDVTLDDRAAFHSRPGLAMSAIQMDWHHWADERAETRQWLERITSPNGVAAPWVKQIGERLLELSRKAVDGPFFPILDAWTTNADQDARRITVVAHLLTQAAAREELSRETHKKLLDWAKKGNAIQRQVVARVCSGPYGQKWPRTTLVRLRHILTLDDAACSVAVDALATYAAIGPTEFTRAVDTVETWLYKHPTHPAGPRAFLALTDADRPEGILDKLIALAQRTPAVRDFIVSGWSTTLEHPEVRDRAYQSLVGWANAVHADRLERGFTFGLLKEVRNVHEPVDAMSRFLYGSPEQENPAIVAARFALANLRQGSNSSQCPHADCPLQRTDNVEVSEAPSDYDARED